MPRRYLTRTSPTCREFHEELVKLVTNLHNDVGALRHEVTRLNDIQAIRTLHFKYGYYWDNILYEQVIQVIDLFTEDVRVQASIPIKLISSAVLQRRSILWKRRRSL